MRTHPVQYLDDLAAKQRPHSVNQLSALIGAVFASLVPALVFVPGYPVRFGNPSEIEKTPPRSRASSPVRVRGAARMRDRVGVVHLGFPSQNPPLLHLTGAGLRRETIFYQAVAQFNAMSS